MAAVCVFSLECVPGHALYPSAQVWHLCGCIERITGGTRQNDGLETGIMGGAAAARFKAVCVLPQASSRCRRPRPVWHFPPACFKKTGSACNTALALPRPTAAPHCRPRTATPPLPIALPPRTAYFNTPHAVAGAVIPGGHPGYHC